MITQIAFEIIILLCNIIFDNNTKRKRYYTAIINYNLYIVRTSGLSANDIVAIGVEQYGLILNCPHVRSTSNIVHFRFIELL